MDRNLYAVTELCTTMTHTTLTGEFETWMRSWGASERTITSRLTVVRAALRLWPDPTEITTAHISDWLGRPHLSRWTRATYYSHLRSFFGWLYETGRIETNPSEPLRRPKSPGNLPRPLAPSEVKRVLAATEGSTHAQLLLGLLAGLRVHEIAKIRGQDVHDDFIFIEGKGGLRAFVPTHPDIWALTPFYPTRGYWFPSPTGGHINSDTLTTKIGKLFRSLNIDGSIHRTRHTYATNLLRSGTNIRVVQSLMRHSSLATTAAYIAVDEDERRAAVNLLVA